MKILLLGAGGREHALAWAITQSESCERLFCAPGNPGMAALADCVDLDPDNHTAVIDFAQGEGIELVVVGPEGPLAGGIADALQAHGIAVFGPDKAGAQLEASKGFTKALCAERGIPTAVYRLFSQREPALEYIKTQAMPLVIKADGLAAGKGVTVATNHADAEAALKAIFSGCFPGHGAPAAVVEEFLHGEEASFFVLCDGENALPLATAQDHKRAYDGDNGPNTGGMGAYSPAPVLSEALCGQVMDEIINPTLAAMRARGHPYRGVLYAGLMITREGPKLIEYNVRLGDPECQVLMMRLDEDILPLMMATATGALTQKKVRWRTEHALTVVMAARGYPGPVEKGSVIKGLDALETMEGVMAFHAGTRRRDDDITAYGGRVLNITALGADLAQARKRAYAAIERIDWPQGFYRKDIGWRVLGTTVRD